MILNLQRIIKSDKSTVGVLSIGTTPFCFTLEDPITPTKIDGMSAIPAGTYRIDLRQEGGMIEDYKKKFGEGEHPGMLWLRSVPNFQWVYLHIGNTPKDTKGCILVGTIYDFRNSDVISASTHSYRKLYTQVLSDIKAGKGAAIRIV